MFGGSLEDRLRRELERRDHFVALMPMRASVKVPRQSELVEAIRAIVAHSGASVELHPLLRASGGDGSGAFGDGPFGRLLSGRRAPLSGRDFFLVVADVALWISFRDGAIGRYGDIARFVNPETWAAGAEELAQTGFHVEICDLGLVARRPISVRDAAFNRAAAVTAAATAIVRMALPLGLLWHPARAALPPSSFRDQLGRMLAGQAPLELWMRWFFLRGEEGERPGVITRGLRSFVGREIEVRPSLRPESEALALAFATASLLVDRGAQLSDGQVLTPVPGLSARVHVGESRARSGLPVFELIPLARNPSGAGPG